MDTLRFTVKLDKKDWLIFSKVVNRRLTQLAKANSKLFIINLIAWIPLGFAIAAYSAMYRKYPFLSEDLNVVGGAIVVGAVLLVVSLVFRNRLYRKVVIAENGSTLAEHRFFASQNELNVSGPCGTTVYPWECFIDHIEENGVIYLFTDNAQALVIPLRNIGSKEEISSLLRWINA
jgi:hypothetical protein